MSPDRLTLTRAEALRRRREEQQNGQGKPAKKRISQPKPSAAPKPSSALPPRISAATSRSRLRARYDVAVTNPYARGAGRGAPGAFRLPSLVLPSFHFGLRWLSGLLLSLALVATYILFSNPFFRVSEAQVYGNGRVTTQDINSVSGILNQPVVLLNPAQIEYNIMSAFPEIYGVYVQVGLPADVTITVSERQPIAAWTQDGQTVWVDAQGFAFPPRGTVEGLISITATGAPPLPANFDPNQVLGARPFLAYHLTAALLTLAPQLPEGSSLIYDPQYGLGWQDPRGWQAYFGQTDGDMAMKLQTYQVLLQNLSQRGATPALISVSYPGAPFYRLNE